MFGTQVEWLVRGVLRLLDRVLPRPLPLRIGLLVTAVWIVCTVGEYFISWHSSWSSRSGTVPNPAYHHLGDAILRGAAFTVLCLAISCGIAYWQWQRRFK